MFKSLDAAQTGINFSNKLNYNDSLTVLDFEYMFNGAGVALLDVNNDSLTDVLFTGNMVSAKLYLNKGNMKFEDITEQAGLQTHGWCYGASIVDINQDGYPDIYICRAGNRNTPADSMRNLFFINNGNNTFTESAKKMGLDDDGYDIQAPFFDYDQDGDLDMYLLRNSFVNYNRNTARAKQTDGGANSTDRLFRNNGDGTFTNVSKEAGITIEGFGLGVNICDINNDNWPDVYVSNDFLTNDLVWINNHNGTFTNMADKMLRHTTYNAMGNDVADFNNDGKEDIAEVDMLPPDNKRWKLTMMGNTYEQFQQDIGFGYQPQYVRNTLQLNNGDGTFSEIGQLSGIAATEWSWAPLFADFDNDGLKDLFVANGYRQDVTNLDFIIYGKRTLFMGTPEANRKDRIDMLQQFQGIKVPNYLFKNNGDLTFKNMAADWGLDDATYSNGAVYGDLDNDGDLDLVINNIDQPASVYENQSNKINPDAKWLRINFKGSKDNRDGLGAKVYTWQGNNMQYLYFSPYRGYLSTVEPFLHFGLQNKAVDSLKVIWPDGKEQLIIKPAVNNLLTLVYSDAHLPGSIKVTTKTSLLFIECNKELQVQYKHKEDEFVDFKLQPLLPHFLSHEGPGISVGDVNGDGLEDFFVGGASGSKGNLFTQQTNGQFAQHQFADSNLADNMGSLLFDADNDGDNDLYVVNGGVCAKKNGDTVYRHAFYLNDGKGNFSFARNALPTINTSGSSVIAADYDHDGDLDLFVGGRVSPGDYPLAPESFLLRNDSKNGGCVYTNVTKQSGISPATLGMVTSALWTDFDNDSWQDLVVVGEFMPIRFFKNVKGIFKEVTDQTGLQNTSGWWNSIVAGDFDNDGDIDYVAGNLGLNGPYKASAKEPVCIYAKDYDKNGRLDPIMCHYTDGTEYMV
ncbi:MAG TPA: VCBS repeat-containing protein, partial [Chitinophagaceae bacterium]|nr:VCBS repeat-containing protein [Chitinophagaceae bacterium]